MLKLFLVLLLGLVVGYQIGWQDARHNEETIVSRTLDRVGGTNRGKYNNDIDAKLDKLDK